MFRNYYKIAIRGLMKNKIFSFINVFSLSIGLVCCILIVLYLYDETSYDSWQKNAKRLYQVGTVFVTGGKEDPFPAEPAVMAANMKNDFPEIEQNDQDGWCSAFLGNTETWFNSYTQPDGTMRSFYEPKARCAADASFFPNVRL